MPETHLTFKCLGHTKRDDCTIANYAIEVSNSRNGRVETLAVTPDHLASARSMKRILLERCMFYSATRETHDEMLLELRPPR